MLRKIFLTAFFLTINIIVYGQTGSIKGTVSNVVTEEPITGVNVGIKNTPLGSVTNAQGKFEITDVKPGTHTLIFSFIGYGTKLKKVKVSKNEAITVDVSLKKSVTELQEIEVIGRSERSYKTDN